MNDKVKKRTEARYNRRVKHGDSDVRDLYLLTRKTTRIPLDNLSILWKGDDVHSKLALFLLYNKNSFSFLSIDARLSDDGNPALVLSASDKVGCAPLVSPINGKICASIIVTGNMKEDISEILPLIEDDIDITFSDNLKLQYKNSIKPPMYFECAKYVEQYYISSRLHWKKFISEEKIESSPSSSTQWRKYAEKAYNPYNILKYPNKKNILSENHGEWRELNYVLKLCLDELSSSHIPYITRKTYKGKVDYLRHKVYFGDVISPTCLRPHNTDPLDIKELKNIGNRILSSITSEYRAWYVDFSRLFESYVQYLFTQVSKSIGSRTLCNYKFAISGSYRQWGLSYLEPDIVLTKGTSAIIADAKYKMHMFNKNSVNVSELKEAFRHDLHQVLAYSSFVRNDKKTAMLIYPYNTFSSVEYRISASMLSNTNKVILVGIPWGNCLEDNNSLPMHKKVKIAIEGLVNLINNAF